MFDYSSLETLRAVEREGTFGRAAQNLGITRSAISQKIGLLEDRWGTAITLRKPVSTTKHGSRLCRHLDQVRLLESKLFFKAGHLFDAFEIEPHAIKLLFDTDLLQTGFLDEVQLYVENQNNFEFEISRTSNTAIQSEIRPGRVVTAISSSWTQSANFKTYQLGQRPFMAVAHPDFIDRFFSSGLTPSAFRMTTCVSYGGSSDLGEQLLAQAFGQSVESRSQRLNSNSGVLHACLNRKGWAILPKFKLTDHLTSGQLVDLFPGQLLSVDLYLYVSTFIAEALPEVANTVLDAARANLEPVKGSG